MCSVEYLGVPIAQYDVVFRYLIGETEENKRIWFRCLGPLNYEAGVNNSFTFLEWPLVVSAQL